MRFQLGLRSVLAHRLRFALCTVAVLLGVAFVAGSLIFTDTLSAALRRTFAGATADLVVTPVPALDRGGETLGTTSARPVTLSADLANRIAAVEGVAGADPHLVIGGVEVLGRDGRPVETYGVPAFGTGWPHDERTASFQLLEGREPWGQGEVALDRPTAGRAGYEPGDTIKVVTPTRTVTATLTGLISPGAAGISAGAPLVAFDSATAQLILLGEPGWTSIEVAIRAGHDPGAVRAAIQQVAGPEVAVRTAAQVSADGENALDDTFGGFSAVLMMFAALALFVGAFLIVNTFSMLTAQRSRELAMLRAIGASRGQVTGSVLVEAVAIGTTGATLGLLLGAGVAAILQFVVGRLDLAVPGGLQLHPRTIIVSYLVGIGVTLAAAYPAARRAGRLPPVAAMRDQVALPERSLRVRLAFGVFVLLMAASCYAIARQARGLPGAILLGFGAAMALLGVMLTSPLVSRYAVGVLTLPFGRRAPVVLGRKNAQRNPRRTTATASALMIALALISGLVVVASSAKASIDKGIADAIGTSDLVVSTDSARPFSSEVAGHVADVPGVASVGRVRSMGGQVGKTAVKVDGVDPGVLEGPVVTKVETGSVAGLRSGQAVLPRDLAKTLDVSVGSSFGLTTASGTHHVTVAAIIAPNRQLDAVLLSLPRFEELGGASTDSTLYVAVTDGPSVDQVRLAVLDRLRDYPSVQVRDQQAYAKSERGPVEVVQSVVAMLLALAILIAVLGIVNTLALGVVERTREIGLLRAIGMDRAQLRRMLQVESIAIALLGALSGVAIGVLFGSAVQAVMAEDGLAVRDIPVLQLLVAVLVSAGVGVLAALWPARRAARLDVLRAIASE